jgi:glycolate oxidase FAD binding subunit
MAYVPPDVRRLIDRIQAARAARTTLDIQGGSTKSFYGERPRGEPLALAELRGITSYEPTELVVTARAGTPLEELEAALAEKGQCLPFEPPRFAPGGSVGGMVAAGITGPARAAAGTLRDYVLGVTLLNGRGELLTFGGQVMKNVAGYDVSRLMAGSWGVLGVLCEISLKVLGAYRATRTLEYDVDQREALATLARWNARPLPITASAWHEARLRVRLSGTPAAVESAAHKLGGRTLEAETAAGWWRSLRDLSHPFLSPSAAELAAGDRLWRISVPATVPPLELPCETASEPPRSPGAPTPGARTRPLIEWNGAQRWCRGTWAAEEIRAAAARAGGHATLVRAADKSGGAFTPVAAALMRIHRELKLAFDPDRVFNPGRLYADL